MSHPVNSSVLAHLLAIEDLTLNPAHAIALMVQEVARALPVQGLPIRWVAGPPIVQAAHNYRLLGYPENSVVQESTYTHWVDDTRMLRTQTTSLVLSELLELASSPSPVVLLAPGMVYRRDVRDRWHCGQPHQMDVWVLMPTGSTSSQALRSALVSMVGVLTGASEADVQLRDTDHPYTEQGVELSVRWDDRWLEIGEAGLIAPDLLARVGLDPAQWTGWAMGWGLDRLVMARKGLPDIRLLRDPLPAVAQQMTHLDSWVPVSRQPVARREISVALPGDLSDEAITERVLSCLDPDQDALVQDIAIVGRWPAASLAPIARQRLGMSPGQENVLVRLTWQAQDDALARDQVNAWMSVLYRRLHQGTAWTYCP